MWEVYGVDTDKLVKFWLSILWRFSISRLPQAAQVQLGPYEDVLENILFHDTGCSFEPAITMLRYRSQTVPAENVCFLPYSTTFPCDQVRLEAYGVAVSGFHAFVKLDPRPLSWDLHQVTINRKCDIAGGYLELEQTQQFQQMRKMAHNMSLKPEARRV
jgi:hypothetical protein